MIQLVINPGQSPGLLTPKYPTLCFVHQCMHEKGQWLNDFLANGYDKWVALGAREVILYIAIFKKKINLKDVHSCWREGRDAITWYSFAGIRFSWVRRGLRDLPNAWEWVQIIAEVQWKNMIDWAREYLPHSSLDCLSAALPTLWFPFKNLSLNQNDLKPLTCQTK